MYISYIYLEIKTIEKLKKKENSHFGESKAIKSNCIVFQKIVQCLQIAKFNIYDRKINVPKFIYRVRVYIKRHFSFAFFLWIYFSIFFMAIKTWRFFIYDYRLLMLCALVFHISIYIYVM